MGRTLFAKIAGEVAPLTEEVCLHLMGEPLSHPEFHDFIRICAGLRLPVNITTNGTLLNAARVEALLEPAVMQVNFSLHSFESNFGGRDIAPYLEKIFDFTRLAFARRPDLYINYPFGIFRRGEFARGSKAAIRRSSPSSNAPSQENRRPRGHFFKEKQARRQQTIHALRHVLQMASPRRPIRGDRGFCHALSRQLGILADGTVVRAA